MQCPSCGGENPPDFVFCGHCGAPLPRRCPHCGFENPPGFSFCGRCGADLLITSVLAPQRALEGERRFAVILFADMAGFTRMSEQLDPEEVTSLINLCLDEMTDAVLRHGGRVDKYIGDGLMAVFGVPTAHEDDPERALRAALMMRERVKELHLGLEIPSISLHIGLACGEVVAAGVGGKGYREYTVIGTSVSLAARLEEASAPGQILVSEDMARLTERAFVFRPRQLGYLPGLTGEVRAFELLRARPRAEQSRHPKEFRSPLVGRDAEFALLWRSLEGVAAGRGGVLSIIGEAGIGKSRLIQEVKAQVEAKSPNLVWLEGHPLEHGEPVRYGCYRALLREAIRISGINLSLPPEELLLSFLEDLLPGRATDIYPYLAQMMDFPLAPTMKERLTRLDGESLKWQTFRVLVECFSALASRKPLVLVLEDLHWIDPTSAELLRRMLALVTQLPLLIVAAYRPDPGRPSWRLRELAGREYADVYTELWLHPLTTAAIEQMVYYLLGAERVSRQALEFVCTRSEGNPLFTEEIVRSLVDRGYLVERERGCWDLLRVDAANAIPDTVQGILQTRIDSLGEETKRVLQMAACWGRQFSRSMLEAVVPLMGVPPDALDLHLKRLEEAGFIEEREGPSGAEYAFRHVLMQEAVRGGLLRERRRAIHLQLAQALERLYAGSLADRYGVLAYHYAQAQQVDRALEYYLKAGDWARANHALEDALRYYEQALTYLKERPDPVRMAKTLMKIALIGLNKFDFQAASEWYEEGFRFWSPPTRSQESAGKEVLRLAIPSWPVLDPAQASDAYSHNVLAQLFEGLGQYEIEEINVLPAAAERWEVGGYGHRYLFFLRRDGCWSDGQPVTAHDFVLAVRRILDPATRSPVAPVLRDIAGARAFASGETTDPSRLGVRALDDWTLEVTLEQPVCSFASLLPFRVFFPVPASLFESYGDGWARLDRIVSNGPFSVREWEEGRLLVLERNPYYPAPFQGNVGRIEYRVARGDVEILALYDADQADAVEASLGDIERLRQRYGEQLVVAPQFFVRYLGFRCDRPPFDDVRLRRAFAQAVDREAMDRLNERLGHLPAMGGFVPPGMPGHSPDIRLGYDPDGARRLMTEVGYPHGEGFPPVQLLVGLRADAQAMATLLSESWRDVLGVSVEVQTCPADEFFQRLTDPPALFILAWTVDFAEPRLFLDLPFHSSSSVNRARWHSAEYDRLVEEAARVADPDRRMEMYHQADSLLVAQEVVVLPLSYGQRVMLVKPWVRNFPASCYIVARYRDVIVDRGESSPEASPCSQPALSERR